MLPILWTPAMEKRSRFSPLMSTFMVLFGASIIGEALRVRNPAPAWIIEAMGGLILIGIVVVLALRNRANKN